MVATTGAKMEKLQVLGDELGEVREEGGVERELDAGDVEAAVFGERVVAMYQKRSERECGEQGAPANRGPMTFDRAH